MSIGMAWNSIVLHGIVSKWHDVAIHVMACRLEYGTTWIACYGIHGREWWQGCIHRMIWHAWHSCSCIHGMAWHGVAYLEPTRGSEAEPNFQDFVRFALRDIQGQMSDFRVEIKPVTEDLVRSLDRGNEGVVSQCQQSEQWAHGVRPGSVTNNVKCQWLFASCFFWFIEPRMNNALHCIGPWDHSFASSKKIQNLQSFPQWARSIRVICDNCWSPYSHRKHIREPLKCTSVITLTSPNVIDAWRAPYGETMN